MRYYFETLVILIIHKFAASSLEFRCYCNTPSCGSSILCKSELGCYVERRKRHHRRPTTASDVKTVQRGCIEDLAAADDAARCWLAKDAWDLLSNPAKIRIRTTNWRRDLILSPNDNKDSNSRTKSTSDSTDDDDGVILNGDDVNSGGGEFEDNNSSPINCCFDDLCNLDASYRNLQTTASTRCATVTVVSYQFWITASLLILALFLVLLVLIFLGFAIFRFRKIRHNLTSSSTSSSSSMDKDRYRNLYNSKKIENISNRYESVDPTTKKILKLNCLLSQLNRGAKRGKGGLSEIKNEALLNYE